ncbi:MAG TPA: hypothetical protein VHY59_08470 [Chthoniobacterales bacterium]|jgi:hypothetical protein|nr:hypothetical protein [Chthoniobacterales bacterium]
MKARCYRKTHVAYARYGGRGIKVCDRWLNSIENFYADMGPRPLGMTLDRSDNDGDYTPENCRWATRAMQIKNSPWTEKHPLNGARRTLRELSAQYGISISALRRRLHSGWDMERALLTPVKEFWNA